MAGGRDVHVSQVRKGSSINAGAILLAVLFRNRVYTAVGTPSESHVPIDVSEGLD